VLGHLFGTHHTDREKDEIVLSITPRIIRMQPRPASENTEFWYGSESRTRTGPYLAADSGAGVQGQAAPSSQSPPPAVAPVPNYGSPQPVSPSVPAGNVSAPLSGASAATPESTSKSMAAPTPQAPQGLATTAVPVPIAPAGPPPENESSDSGGTASGEAPAAAPTASARPAARGGARSAVSLDGPTEAKVGDEFQVVVQLSSQEGITRLRSQLRFEASALQLISATVGDVVPAAAGGPAVNMKGGGAQLDVVTSPDDPVQGSGSLMVLRFKALAPRGATNVAAMLNVLGGTGAAVGSSSAQPLRIAIQQ
jgi:general secretion pathway protein D